VQRDIVALQVRQLAFTQKTKGGPWGAGGFWGFGLVGGWLWWLCGGWFFCGLWFGGVFFGVCCGVWGVLVLGFLVVWLGWFWWCLVFGVLGCAFALGCCCGWGLWAWV
ncbi:hypothetical protein RA277_28030, partial [Pseudomonas syringae pv. tagetis]